MGTSCGDSCHLKDPRTLRDSRLGKVSPSPNGLEERSPGTVRWYVAAILLGVLLGVTLFGVVREIRETRNSVPGPYSRTVAASSYLDVAIEAASTLPIPEGTSLLPELILPRDTMYADLVSTLAFRGECLWVAGIVAESVTRDGAIGGLTALAKLDTFRSGIEERIDAVERQDLAALRRHIDLNCESVLTKEVGYERIP